jgi:hypothetical protein
MINRVAKAAKVRRREGQTTKVPISRCAVIYKHNIMLLLFGIKVVLPRSSRY